MPLKFSDIKKEDDEDSTTRIGDQDRILFVAWSRAIIGGHSSGVRKLRSNPEPNLEASGHFVTRSESRGRAKSLTHETRITLMEETSEIPRSLSSTLRRKDGEAPDVIFTVSVGKRVNSRSR